MPCGTCSDKGVVTVNWADAPTEYAVCLCPIGMDLRRRTNNGHATPPYWLAWAAREQVDPKTVVMLEDVLEPDELRERGLMAAPVSAIDAIAAAGRNRSRDERRR